MPGLSGLEWTFDTVASTYEKFRPGYVKELYKTIFNYIPVNKNSNVLEVGSGAGQATDAILQTGCYLTAVEYGEKFCTLLKEKFINNKNFCVVKGKFEDVPFTENTFDLIFSATAFHWVPEEIGYKKVYALLKKGGVFARFANHPYRDKGNSELAKEIENLYASYYDKYYHTKKDMVGEYSEQQAKDLAMVANKYGFYDIQYALFYRQRVFSAKEYIKLLGTYSDHIAMEEKFRKEFFSKIEEAINSYGGTITIYDTIDLQLARK